MRQNSFHLAALAIAALSTGAFAADDVDLTFIETGADKWQFMLVDKDHAAVDARADFATWVKQSQAALAAARPARSFTSVHVHGQCFGGGFLHALKKEGVTKFGASSASRYWEPASYDLEHERSYFTFAWASTFDSMGAATKDKVVTQATANALRSGTDDIPFNPGAAHERPQYLTDGGPFDVGGDVPRYAILWAGVTDDKDENDMEQMRNQLIDNGWAEENIMVLFGDETLHGGKEATKANLEWAWKTWLVGKIKAQSPRQTEATVFFFAGDHGNASASITISVGLGSWGQFGTAISAAANPERSIWVAGNGEDQSLRWTEPLARDIDAIAFGDDYAKTDVVGTYGPEVGVYFSVDTATEGVEGSDVARELEAERVAAGDVFVGTAGSNRQMIDGERSLGLDETLNDDDVDALILRDVTLVTDPKTNTMTVPIFYSTVGDPRILVYDPVLNLIYVYFDFALVDADGDGVIDPAPKELDALAMCDDGARVAVPHPDDPTKTIEVLFFDSDHDEFLFSIGRGDVVMPWMGFEPCEVLRFGTGGGAVKVTVFRSCESIGLEQETDDLDALDVIPGGAVGFRDPPSPSCPGSNDPDVNGDGHVDGGDVAIILSQWGACDSICSCIGDLDDDGVVSGSDITIVLGQWSP